MTGEIVLQNFFLGLVACVLIYWCFEIVVHHWREILKVCFEIIQVVLGLGVIFAVGALVRKLYEMSL